MERQNHKIGLIGFGGMAGWHRELIGTIDQLEVAGIYDIRQERMDLAQSMGVKTYADTQALLADPDIDMVLIATPNDMHKPLAIQAMKAGKHVICEKPVTLCSRDLEEMIQASEEYGVFFTVHQNRRWDEDFLTVRKILEEGSLGEVFRIESRVHGSRGIPGDWRQEKQHGGGMVLDWGVHLLDQILLLEGEKKVRKVYATCTNVTNQLVDDGFTVELTFEDGLVVLIEVGTSNFISLPRWYVLGQDGTAIIEDWKLTGRIVRAAGADEKDVVPVKTAAGLTKTMAPRRDDSIFTEELPGVSSDIRDFYRNVMDVIEGRAESKIKLPEIARVMRLMEAIFESDARGQVIDFE